VSVLKRTAAQLSVVDRLAQLSRTRAPKHKITLLVTEVDVREAAECDRPRALALAEEVVQCRPLRVRTKRRTSQTSPFPAMESRPLRRRSGPAYRTAVACASARPRMPGDIDGA
jgi:hypothetical protein